MSGFSSDSAGSGALRHVVQAMILSFRYTFNATLSCVLCIVLELGINQGVVRTEGL